MRAAGVFSVVSIFSLFRVNSKHDWGGKNEGPHGNAPRLLGKSLSRLRTLARRKDGLGYFPIRECLGMEKTTVCLGVMRW
jgi:hypothetical protein